MIKKKKNLLEEGENEKDINLILTGSKLVTIGYNNIANISNVQLKLIANLIDMKVLQNTNRLV